MNTKEELENLLMIQRKEEREKVLEEVRKMINREISRYRLLPGNTDFHKGRFDYAKELLSKINKLK